MAIISEAKALFGEWIATVSRAVDALADRFVRSRRIRLAERDDGGFTASTIASDNGAALPDVSFRLEAGRPQPPLPAEWTAAFRGSRVEAELLPAHIMTHLLDFPSKASDFLDGMIRAQIDRLTPWTAIDAAFGYGPPAEAGPDRMVVTVAATARAQVQPLVDPLSPISDSRGARTRTTRFAPRCTPSSRMSASSPRATPSGKTPATMGMSPMCRR